MGHRLHNIGVGAQSVFEYVGGIARHAETSDVEISGSVEVANLSEKRQDVFDGIAL